MSELTVPQLFEAAGRQLKQDFERIRETNPHSGEKGSEIEDVLRNFLNAHLPQRFRATSGVLIDVAHSRSRQTDVIVYDALSSPIYRASERLQILPAHTTAAVVEVKASLNAASLADGYAKIHSCKSLKSEPRRPVDRSATDTPIDSLGILGVIFGFSSDLTLVRLAEHAAELNKQYDSDHWPDVIVVLDRGLIDYGVSPPGQGMPVNRLAPRAPASEDAFGSPPYFVQLLVEEVGASTLNHFFLQLLAHLMFFPLRAGLPHWRKGKASDDAHGLSMEPCRSAQADARRNVRRAGAGGEAAHGRPRSFGEDDREGFVRTLAGWCICLVARVDTASADP
jgi:hypothetical protein